MDSEVKSLKELNIELGEELLNASEEVDQTETSIQQESYVTILKEENIWRLVEDEIQSVSELTLLSKSEATLVLSYFQWDVKRFHEEWFVNEKSVRKSVGILEPPTMTEDSKTISEDYFFCGVCEESQLLENFASVSCGHLVCTCCWKSHINEIINETRPADWFWKLKCPYCPASVDRDMIESYASEEEKSKYNRYLLESYVGSKKTMKWCPAECGCAIDATSDSGNFYVTCSCLFHFCWNCRKDAHSPVDCRSAAKWLAMNTSDDSQYPDWVLEHTVPCPKCNRRVEENQDVSLKMTCLPPCNYVFCWHCRGDWSKHGEELYTCTLDANSYGESGELRKMAESAAYKYRECYENWKSNELLMLKAKANLTKLHDVIEYLSNTQLPTEPQLEFIIKARLQIVESVRVLKWTYAYEYYLRENEVGKREFLKILQENAKTYYLKRLDDCVESELPPFLDAVEPSQDFNNFRIKLTGLTSVTRNHYESLVRVLEEGLANVVAHNGEASGSGTNHEDDLVELIVDFPV